MKITDVKCAVIGKNPVVRIVTDGGLSGWGQAEQYKPYLKPYVLHYRDALIGMDPTDVERCMLKIRQRGAFKPWGASVSMIEMALWDVAGKAAGLPVYKLLGGKVRDHVRVYNGALRMPLPGCEPEHYAEEARRMKALPEGSRPTWLQRASPCLPSASVRRKTLEMLWIENGTPASPTAWSAPSTVATARPKRFGSTRASSGM